MTSKGELAAALTSSMGVKRPPKDEITKRWDLAGRRGRAWLTNLDAARAEAPGKPDSALVQWLIEAEWAHPLWHSYLLSLIHLRDVPGLPPAKLYDPQATHELVLFALVPEPGRQALIERGRVGPDTCLYLEPKNFAAQLICRDDATAIEIVKNAVVDICNGALSPDTDHRQAWIDRFGDNMMKG